MDDIAARLAITVETGNAIRDLDNLREKINSVTEAREKNLRVSTNASGKTKEASGVKLSKEAIKEEIAASNRVLQKQRDELTAVNKIIEERGTKSVEELKIEQAAARQVTAEYRQQRAELALLRAEQKYNSANKNLALAKLNKDDPRRIVALADAAEEYKKQWTAAQQVAADAALSARKAATDYQNLISPVAKLGDATRNTTAQTKKLTAQQILSRSAARALRIDLGEGASSSMIKLGIIAAGAAASVKVLMNLLERLNDNSLYKIELSNKNLDSTTEATKRIQERITKQNDLIESIDNLQKKESMSNVEKLEMSKLLRQLSSDYESLGISIDDATGKLNGWNEAREKSRKKALEKELYALERQRKEIQKNREIQTRTISGKENIAVQIARVSPWGQLGIIDPEIFGGIVTSFDKGKIDSAAERMNELAESEQEASERISDLRKALKSFDEDSARQREAEKKDLDDQIKKQRSIYKIQEMRAMGMDREAKYAEIIANWEGKRLKYGSAVDEFIDSEKRLYDLSAKREQENVFADLMSSRFRLRETAQSATFANTLEAARLQSRMMLGASGINLSDNPQKTTAEQSKKQVALLEELRTRLDSIITGIDGISTQTV